MKVRIAGLAAVAALLADGNPARAVTTPRFVPIAVSAPSSVSRPIGQSVDPDEDSLALSMDGWRVRGEGQVLRFQREPAGHACHQGDPSLAGPGGRPDSSSGFLELPGRITAMAAWGRRIYAAIDGSNPRFIRGQQGDRDVAAPRFADEVLVVEVSLPMKPGITRRFPRQAWRAGGRIFGLDVIGTTLYLLTDEGLVILDTSSPVVRVLDRDPRIAGRRIDVFGRVLRVTREDGSVVVYRDTVRAPLHFDVAVNENFYAPKDLVIDVGDTVRWTNGSGTLHNVVSCTPDQKGCDGTTSSESFDSGDPDLFFVFDHTFTQAGSNPYICEPHAPFMTGSVTVSGTSGSPPGVPDGATGSPMTVERMSTDGSVLALSWDTSTCSGALDHEILFGYPYGFPPATGSGYEPAGSRCAIGSASPYVWSGAPAAFPGPSGLLWFLVVATDGAATEGSWGEASNGLERQGPGPNGSSMECGIVTKSLANICGH